MSPAFIYRTLSASCRPDDSVEDAVVYIPKMINLPNSQSAQTGDTLSSMTMQVGTLSALVCLCGEKISTVQTPAS